MTQRTEKDKMLAGELYRSSDGELVADRRHAQDILTHYNALSGADQATLTARLREVVGTVGEGTVILPSFSCDYGYNIHLGKNVFVNYQCVFLDCARIDIGDDVQIGPAVQLYTAQHPLDPAVRRSYLESAKPIRIGNDVWIGGAVVVLPGVTVGDRSVVGAGTVVVRDVPPDTVVVGNPARVVRTLT